jgi:hypothetical protein
LIDIQARTMNFLDPFFLFVSIEIIALLVLLVFWLDLGFSFVYVALHGHVTPEIAALLFPRVDEDSPAPKEEALAPVQQWAPEVSESRRCDIARSEEPEAVIAD